MEEQKHSDNRMQKRKYNKPRLRIDELSDALFLAGEELKQKNARLTEMEKERTAMFENLSHDLRSPVTALRSSIEYLTSLDEISNDELHHILHVMNTRVRGLEQMIEDMFLITVLENRSIELKTSQINIGMLLEDFFYSCEADSRYEKRKLILDVPEVFPPTVMIDPEKIVRVLDNLFSNALKYSKDDSVIRLAAKENGDEVIIQVSDTGIGMENDELKKIFDRTYMIDKSRSPDVIRGSGLGLSIVKSIIEQHEGKIWCESIPGTGSIFSFTLKTL